MVKTRKPEGITKNLTSYGDNEFSLYIRRAFLASAGFDSVDLSRPIVGIVDTSSDYNTCHRQMPEMVAAVKRGVLQAGGLPLAFPTISLHEILTSPTTMLFRNLAAMDTEEMIRAQPMDAVVLLSGCDKTVPAQIMAAVSADIPAVSVVAGPMLTGFWRGERLGACTDCRRFWASYRAGELTKAEIDEIEGSLCFTGGTCMVMGTASTMACLVEALGLMLPGGAAIPHAAGRRLIHAAAAGRRAVEMIREGLTPSRILSKASFSNALVVLAALAGSTNAVIHLLAVARRAGIDLSLAEFDETARRVPVLVDVKPAGSGYLEDFFHAGGMPALLKVLSPLLDHGAATIAGKTIGRLIDEAPQPFGPTIRPLSDPLREVQDPGALAVIRGTLAPGGAVLKAAAASPGLFSHRGPAVVFESPADAVARIDDPALGITADHVMVLRNAGPVAAGMPEAGSLQIPRYLAARGVKDMVRVSDGRMSGTAYGTVVLHVSPEAAVGGPLALVSDGDIIELDVGKRRIDLLVDDKELAARRDRWKAPAPPARGYRRLFFEHVLQAEEGCDFDFL
ncbi:MAG: dihydroxy-acid dehydratase [Deltaproteobacteria bacterium]|nr:dihydroxy-acid dehydratase [Candidatus Zymogenaceae bacterium]